MARHAIIHEGVPFPSYRNAGMLLSKVRPVLQVVLPDASMWLVPVTIESVTVSGTEWRASARREDTKFSTVVQGRFATDGRPIIVQIGRVDNGRDDAAPHRIIRFEQHYYDELAGFTCPLRIVDERSERIREVYTIHSLQVVTPERVAELGKAPEDRPAQARDFRRGNAEAWEGITPEISKMVWTREEGRDAYRFVDDAAAPMTSGLAAGQAPSSTGFIDGGRVGETPKERSSARPIIALLVVLGAAGLAVLVSLRRGR